MVATFIFYLFTWLCQVYLSDGIEFPDQGSNLGPLHWEYGFLTTGLLDKSILNRLWDLISAYSFFSNLLY